MVRLVRVVQRRREVSAISSARYPSVVDSTGAVRAALRAPPILPTSYVVRADGSVHRVDPPVVFRTVAEVRRNIEKYLGET